MIKAGVLTVVLSMLSCIAFAGGKEDLAREVLKVTEISAMSGRVVEQVLKMHDAQVSLIKIPESRRAEQASLHDTIRQKLNDAVRWELLEAEYGTFLVETYTEDELQAILDFSRSERGRSIVKKEPVIMGKIMLLMQSRIQSVLPEIQKMTRDFSESVKKIK